VLIKVTISGSNPKDWKFFEVLPEYNGFNSGDGIAGIVESVGSEATWEFKPGDRVAAYHTQMTPPGAYAEYALASATTTFHIPPGTSFQEAATIPLCAMIVALGPFSSLRLPEPWVGVSQARTRVEQWGIIVYGAASAVGAFAIKLRPIISDDLQTRKRCIACPLTWNPTAALLSPMFFHYTYHFTKTLKIYSLTLTRITL
jgi:NADPH:quinone reductase